MRLVYHQRFDDDGPRRAVERTAGRRDTVCRCTVVLRAAGELSLPATSSGPKMSPLFRRSEEKVARKAAAKQEIERLRALSVDDLSADVLPALGPDGPTRGTSVRVQQLCGYLLRDYPGAGQLDTLDLLAAVTRALDRLQDARLVSPISVQRTPVWRITPLGESTLAEGNVRERLRRR